MAGLPHMPAFLVYVDEDTEPIVARTRQIDMLTWEETAHKHKWPPTSEAPGLLSWFVAWAALRRTNQLPAALVKWEDFKSRVAGVAPMNENGDASVDPTDPAPGTD